MSNLPNRPRFPNRRVSHNHREGFTIVELLVVIGVIGVLLGLLFPALAGAQKKSAKTSEVNSIRQVHYAWMMYATNNNDAALPGYLDIDVQAKPVANVSRGWGVTYEYPTPPNGLTDKTIPPAPSYDPNEPNIAGPWTWRLLPYLDYSHKMVHGYVDETDESMFELVAEGEEIAEEPAFGYNGFYIGGYWRMHPVDNIDVPQFDFVDDCETGGASAARLSIPTGVAQIAKSSEMVSFCSSSKFDQSVEAPGLRVKIPSDRAGSYLVTPPTVREEAHWRPDPSDPTAVNIQSTTGGVVYAPIGRYTGYPAVLYADGHAESTGVNALFDQRKWINHASIQTFTHNLCTP